MGERISKTLAPRPAVLPVEKKPVVRLGTPGLEFSEIRSNARGASARRKSPASSVCPGVFSTSRMHHSSVRCGSRRLRLPRRAGFDPFSPSVGSWRVEALHLLLPLSRLSGAQGQPSSRQNRSVSRRNLPKSGGQNRRSDPRPFSLGSHWRADGAPKAVFRSQQEALRAANVRQLESGVTLTAYECDFCSRWHLGSSTARER
jgi:hypothetical protein